MKPTSFILKAIIFFVGLLPALDTLAELPLEYRKNIFALDLSLGANIDLSSLNQAQQAVFDSRPSVVTQIAMRPSYFFSRHWGAYADLRFNLFRFDDKEKIVDILMPGLSKLKPSFSIGINYRYERARWQLQPRLGIGLNSYGGGKSKITVGGEGVEQKVEGDMMCLDAGLSFAYRTSRVCSLFLDIDAMPQLTPAKYTRISTAAGKTTTSVVKSHSWGSNMSIAFGIRFQTSGR